MNKWKTWLLWGVGIFIGFAIVGAFIGTPQTDKSKATTQRNGFISGCKQEIAKYPSVSQESCGCAYDRLITAYPGLFNEDNLNRILTQGYTQQETDVIAPCFGSTE